ncbi:hypothetical protein L836_5474 [Mycobacteroides abscessus MAB_110811_2726]|nr:hypothetical protein L836_5474 [Mycobacteroides abscessus MAB_110811_2726]
MEVTTAGGDQVSMVALTAVVAAGTCRDLGGYNRRIQA